VSYGLLFTEINRVVLDKKINEQIVIAAFPSLNYCYDKIITKMKIDKTMPVLLYLTETPPGETRGINGYKLRLPYV
jgi:hypothetical protein